MKEFKVWVHDNLAELIGFVPGRELVDYILTFETRDEIENGLSSLIDLDEERNKQFLNTFFKRWTPPKCPGTNYETRVKIVEESPMLDEKAPVLDKKSPMSNQKSTKFSEISPALYERPPIFCEKSPLEIERESSNWPNKSPFHDTNKYVSLYSADGKVKSKSVLLPGRHWCQCMAQKHKLVNNCVECGRIVCEQEGAGPCLFCHNLVCSPEDQEYITRESKKGRKLHEKLMQQTQVGSIVAADQSLDRAVAHKDKLLHYDQHGTERTQVIDDEGDYYSVNNRWIEKEVKEELKRREAKLDEMKSKSRRDKKFTLDLIGRNVIEAESKKEENLTTNEMGSETKDWNQNDMRQDSNQVKALVNPTLNFPSLEFQYCHIKQSKEVAAGTSKKQTARVQDRGLQEMTDQGVCLSIHQPWASLLVKGIKKLEGRNWYTKHRGRLWVASTVQIPCKETVDEVETRYREIFADRQDCPEFPKAYPTGALLGSVNVVDCLTYEEYCDQNPNGLEENNSEYVFICEHPEELTIKLPVKGKHKIYHLEKSTLNAARNLVRKI